MTTSSDHRRRSRVHFVTTGAATLCLLTSVSCSDRAITVEYRNGYTFSRSERQAIEAIADRAVRDAREILPALPAELRLTVQTGTKVIPETGETAEVGVPGGVYWTVDPAHAGGVIAVVNAQLRATLFHEFVHLIREAQFTAPSLTDRAISEGLATAFERDFGDAPTPWGAYPQDVAGWTKEFLAHPADAPSGQWMSKHPDGRRWIGYKVGTYLVDRAVQNSGLSLAQLATVPTERIIQWSRPER
jgi:hypothetical protein